MRQFIYHLIEERDMDIEVMIDDFVTMFLAGQETTANTLAFTFYKMIENKKLFKKLAVLKI